MSENMMSLLSMRQDFADSTIYLKLVFTIKNFFIKRG